MASSSSSPSASPPPPAGTPSKSASSLSSPPLVWVRQGKTQHAAYLLNADEGLVQWASTQTTDIVELDTIDFALTPRRRHQRIGVNAHPNFSSQSGSPQTSEKKRKLSSENESLRLALHHENDIRNDSDDGATETNSEDDVVVLLTIMPPTQKRTKQNEPLLGSDAEFGSSSGQGPTSNSDNAVLSSVTNSEATSASAQSYIKTQNARQSTILREKTETQSELIDSEPQGPACSAAFESDSVDETNDDPRTAARGNAPSEPIADVSLLPPTYYSYRSSAYVQNLAEICYTLLHDRRWRVGGTSQKRLLAWERGDDMSAIYILSRLFDRPPIKSYPPKRRACCACLLCREKKKSRNDELKSPISEGVGAETKAVGNAEAEPDARIDDTEKESDDRAIHLFCRVYYRKGPWYRLDDVYNRYYAPKLKESPDDSSDNQDCESAENKSLSTEVVSEKQSNIFQISKQTKFSYSGKSSGGNSGRTREDVIDEESLRLHLAAVDDLFDDIDRLRTLGLIRSFHSEEECGKTVGAVTREGSGVILTAEERRCILAKLGCKDKQKQRRHGDNNSTSGDRWSMRLVENTIWKHMRQQKTMLYGLAAYGGSRRSTSLLPVRRHVDAELFDKLARCIVMKCSTVDFIPARLLRECVSDVKRIIQKSIPSLIDGRGRSAVPNALCFRLRENPLFALRRAARLYLCATHGPGDMRGDGTNGWKSLLDINVHSSDLDIPLFNVVRPPGAHTFHQASYPAMSHRFGLAKCSFLNCYSFIACTEGASLNERETRDLSPDATVISTDSMEQVFLSVAAFKSWEAAVELRAQVDYLIALNDMMRYQERRRLRGGKDSENEVHENAPSGKSQIDQIQVDLSDDEVGVDVDFLELLSSSGRRVLISRLLAGPSDEIRSAHQTQRSVLLVNSSHKAVEHAILALEQDAPDTLSSSLSDCERIICVISIIITKILLTRWKSVASDELSHLSSRPWLRHLWWDAVLTYALWDSIAVLERTGLYGLAASAIESILFGSLRLEKLLSTQSLGSPSAAVWMNTTRCERGFSLGELLVSRRTRGKLFERLVIDYTHLLRRQVKVDAVEEARQKESSKRSQGQQRLTPQSVVASMCSDLIPHLACTAVVPFSALRSLVRRTRTPLADAMKGTQCPERDELSLRLGNTSRQDERNPARKGYSDWSPTTDTAIANAMGTDEQLVGRRCSFVGFEDRETDIVQTSSLNVEELAMEFYGTGRLPSAEAPCNKLTAGGGWQGWHDEGGHIRALFRIICAEAVFGMDSGCGEEPATSRDELEHRTIFLTPYQGAPHDLHVGFWTAPVSKPSVDNIESSFKMRGFYVRRRDKIDAYLRKLELLDSQAISDLVHDTIIRRLELAGTQKTEHASLMNDLQQVRTLSMLAAGFGGVQLAAMFRALMFDYRHYSGGLPDLLLTRALYSNDKSSRTTASSSSQEQVVDLGQWVGESFSAKAKAQVEEAQHASLLLDKDDEFLGCTKVGDSATRSNNRWRRNRNSSSNRPTFDVSCDNIPDKLNLHHNGRRIDVQCMFVEVKSQNDRLDGRQEDWLNILDRVGNARVCKFGIGKKPKKATTAALAS